MGCGASRLEEDQEITIEDQTKEGRLGMTNDEDDSKPKMRRGRREEKIETFYDSSSESGDYERFNTDSEQESSEFEESVMEHKNGFNKDIVDVINASKVKQANNKLERIEKMDGANASFMRRTNSLRATCSFKSECSRDLNADSSDEEGMAPLAPNPWDSRNLLRTPQSGKSVLSQSGVNVAISKKERSVSRAGAFLNWECSKDSIGSLEHVVDVVFLSEQHLAVSQDCESKQGLQLYDVAQRGHPGNTLGAAWLTATRCACVNHMDANTIAVTDPQARTVKFLNSMGDGIGSWKNDILKMPASIAVNSEGKYIVADVMAREKAINIFTSQGKLIKSFGIGFFDWPWYLTVDSHDRIIVSEQSSSTGVVFDKNGKFLSKFARHGKGEGRLNFPNGVVVDHMDNIFIADTNNYRVSMFSPDGVFIKNILNHLNYKPLSLAFNDSGHLAVVSDKSVHLYQTYEQKSFLL